MRNEQRKRASAFRLIKRGAEPYLLMLLLAAAVLAVYAPVGNFRFVDFDDNEYVTDNSQVKLGLNWKGFVWAFTATQASNWHPLTWLSHMVDVSLWGMNPGGHHLTNVFFHAANTALLFLLLRIMTTALWPSALVAALFALHPLHVESVAWVAERKDVLSTFFGLLAILAYVRYAERPDVRRYLPVLLLFALSLLAKPMLVTLPFLLLLLDYWPLARIESVLAAKSTTYPPPYPRRPFVTLLLEKIPLITLSGASSVTTIFAQSRGGSVFPFDHYSLGPRVGNAVISYLGYLGKTIWPTGLAPFYPLSLQDLSWWKTMTAVLVVTAISLAAFKAARSYPYLAVGWLWYLGALVPVIGLVQVGAQSMADRYTYIPIVGIFVTATWGLVEVSHRWPWARMFVAGSACLVLGTLAILTRIQLGYWHDTVALFQHTAKVTKDNWLAHNNLGVALKAAGEDADAQLHFEEAVRIKPNYARARANLGDILRRKGKLEEALAIFDGGGQKDTYFPEFHNNRAITLSSMGRYQEAIKEYHQAMRLDPSNPVIYFNLANALSKAGNGEEAVREYRTALRLKPDYVQARNNLGALLGAQGKADEAIAEYRELLRIQPDSAEAHYNLGIELNGQGKSDEAVDHFRQALKIRPGYTEARVWLERVLAKMSRSPGP